MAGEANYKIIVEQPFQRRKSKRLIALYDRDPERKFDSSIKKGRILR